LNRAADFRQRVAQLGLFRLKFVKQGCPPSDSSLTLLRHI
jgi:hypothetical protein